MPIDGASPAVGVDGEAVVDADVSAFKSSQQFAHAKGVFLVNAATGEPYAASGGGGGGDATAALQTAGNASLASIAGLAIPAHDYVGLTYTTGNLTGVVYKTGGGGGTTVATLTLAYSGSDLTSVARS